MHKSKSLEEIKHFFDHYKALYKRANPRGRIVIRYYLDSLKRHVKQLHKS